MRKRMLTPAPAERAAFGLIAWLEQTKLTLPLKGVECAFSVCGDVVSVEIDQIFHQSSAQPLDCIYTFPLPAGAAVYRCEMHLDGRVIRAKVEERDRARELAREKKAAGFRTALVEMERDNLFTLSLGNVQPGDLIVIRFAYFQTLSRLGDWTSFSIPFCPGVRYIPGTPLLRAPKGRGVVEDTDQVPDASRISPPRMDKLHADAAYLSVAGTLEHPLGEVKDISSPSHPVFVRMGAAAPELIAGPAAMGSCTEVALADQGAVPDSDFVLRWTEVQPPEVRPMAWTTRSQNETFALIRLRAPEQVAVSDLYSQDVYFLIDRSGSMQGLKWEKAVEAFRAFLNVLGQADRVWATFFESGFRDLAEKPLPAPEALSDRGVAKLEALGTAGGTELLPALEHVLGKVPAHSAGRPASLLLITDGQIGNEAAVLQRLARHRNLRVHVFGIDVAINDGFLNKLAAQHQGTSCLLSPQDDIVGAVRRLGNRLRRPVLTSIRVPQDWELPTQELPDLHGGEVLSLPLKYVGQRFQPVSHPGLQLDTTLPDGTRRSFHFDLAPTDAPALPLLWAKRRIDFLLAQGKTSDAITMAKASNLVCEGTAFIAWDETQKVQVSGPEREVYQPSMELACLEARSLGAMPPRTAAGAEVGLLAEDLHEACFAPPPLRRRLLRALLPRHRDAVADLAQWRAEAQQESLFQTAPGVELLDWLLAWARAHPAGIDVALAALGVLLRLLRRGSSQPAAGKLQIIRDWIEQQLKGEQRKQALAKLVALEPLAQDKA